MRNPVPIKLMMIPILKRTVASHRHISGCGGYGDSSRHLLAKAMRPPMKSRMVPSRLRMKPATVPGSKGSPHQYQVRMDAETETYPAKAGRTSQETI